MPSMIEPGKSSTPPEPSTPRESAERSNARRRLERKRKFSHDLTAYVAINVFLIGVWAASGFGYFWPGWVAGGWGVLLVLDAWAIFYRRPITEADIDREVRKQS